MIGIDDHPWSDSFNLTTVRQRPQAQGAAAVRLVLDELAGIPMPGLVIQHGIDLVVRGTTAPPQRNAS